MNNKVLLMYIHVCAYKEICEIYFRVTVKFTPGL